MSANPSEQGLRQNQEKQKPLPPRRKQMEKLLRPHPDGSATHKAIEDVAERELVRGGEFQKAMARQAINYDEVRKIETRIEDRKNGGDTTVDAGEYTAAMNRVEALYERYITIENRKLNSRENNLTLHTATVFSADLEKAKNDIIKKSASRPEKRGTLYRRRK